MNESNNVKVYMKKALFELMQKKDFFEISVSELVKKASVARASFYRNYTTTYDILDDFCADIITNIATEMLPALFTNDYDLWNKHIHTLIHRTTKPEEALSSLKGENLLLVFSNITTVYNHMNTGDTSIDTYQKYRIIAIVGIVTNVINAWINNGYKESEDELAEILVQLIMKV